MESAAEAARRTATEVAGGDAARPVRAVRPVELPDGQRSAASVLRDYVALTKPRIISLLLLTTVASMFVADPSGPALSTVLWTVLGGYLAAGGAGAINQYLEREADARMARTRG
ncbi:MAG: UbiA family prenyltransferase, partial [Solirubrobacterales bacterium]